MRFFYKPGQGSQPKGSITSNMRLEKRARSMEIRIARGLTSERPDDATSSVGTKAGSRSRVTRQKESNLRPPGYEPGELTAAPWRNGIISGDPSMESTRSGHEDFRFAAGFNWPQRLVSQEPPTSQSSFARS